MQKDALFYAQSILVTIGIFGFFWLLAFGVFGTYFRGGKSLKSVAKVSIFWGAVFMGIAIIFFLYIGARMLGGG